MAFWWKSRVRPWPFCDMVLHMSLFLLVSTAPLVSRQNNRVVLKIRSGQSVQCKIQILPVIALSTKPYYKGAMILRMLKNKLGCFWNNDSYSWVKVRRVSKKRLHPERFKLFYYYSNFSGCIHIKLNTYTGCPTDIASSLKSILLHLGQDICKRTTC